MSGMFCVINWVCVSVAFRGFKKDSGLTGFCS